MSQIKLSPRLTMILNLIEPCQTFADIGTDHGYLPLALLEGQIIKMAYLCDVNQGPLDNARSTFESSDFVERVTYRLGSGLSVLSVGEVECAAIAGMGGQLILNLIQESLSQFKSLSHIVLQPMTEQNNIREWLRNHGYEFIDYFVQEGSKHYEILSVYPSGLNQKHLIPTEIKTLKLLNDYEFGYCIDQNHIADYHIFLNFKRQKYQRILDSISKIVEPNSDQMERLAYANSKLNCIHDIEKILGGIK